MVLEIVIGTVVILLTGLALIGHWFSKAMDEIGELRNEDMGYPTYEEDELTSR